MAKIYVNLTITAQKFQFLIVFATDEFEKDLAYEIILIFIFFVCIK